MSDQTVLQLTDISKRFGSLKANDAINLHLDRGEVLALLGENGAGKTTLMNILFGHYVADRGRVEVLGRHLPPGKPGEAIKAGVGMVHQHFTLAENLTVLDNIIAGTRSLWSSRYGSAGARERLAELARDFGLEVDPEARVADLSVGQRQRVEILKALYRRAKILILDEPTAVLTPQEAESLFQTLRRLVTKGLSVILISHKLSEVMAASDRIVVLRRGRVVANRITSQTDPGRLAEDMVGRAVSPPVRTPLDPGEAVMAMSGLGVDSGDGRGALADIGLTVRAREIVGIAGVSGNGQSLLADLACGLIRPQSGGLELYGRRAGDLTPRRAHQSGVGRIPEDRLAVGLIGDMSIEENLVSETYPDSRFSRRGVLRFAAIRDYAAGLIDNFDVRCPGPGTRVRELSGGNIQKLLLARAISPEPGFILANQPTRGLDVGAIVYVHQRLLEARGNGAGILLISEDLDEIFQLADRIAVIFQGRLSQAMPVEEVTKRRIGLMMSGHHPDNTPDNGSDQS